MMNCPTDWKINNWITRISYWKKIGNWHCHWQPRWVFCGVWSFASWAYFDEDLYPVRPLSAIKCNYPKSIIPIAQSNPNKTSSFWGCMITKPVWKTGALFKERSHHGDASTRLLWPFLSCHCLFWRSWSTMLRSLELSATCSFAVLDTIVRLSCLVHVLENLMAGGALASDTVSLLL